MRSSSFKISFVYPYKKLILTTRIVENRTRFVKIRTIFQMIKRKNIIHSNPNISQILQVTLLFISYRLRNFNRLHIFTLHWQYLINRFIHCFFNRFMTRIHLESSIRKHSILIQCSYLYTFLTLEKFKTSEMITINIMET